MKTVIALFLATMILPTCFLFSQNAVQVSLKSHPVLQKEWQQTENWLQTFRTTFGKDAATNWMSELAMDGEFYLNTETGGFIIVLPKYMQSYAKLKAKFQYGIYENKNTRLLPIMDEADLVDNLWTTRFLGYLGGIPASLDMAVVKQDDKYLTVMGFYPGQELSNDFSKKFQRLVEQTFAAPVYAAR